jgi:regulator of replication initiation timing
LATQFQEANEKIEQFQTENLQLKTELLELRRQGIRPLSSFTSPSRFSLPASASLEEIKACNDRLVHDNDMLRFSNETLFLKMRQQESLLQLYGEMLKQSEKSHERQIPFFQHQILSLTTKK